MNHGSKARRSVNRSKGSKGVRILVKVVRRVRGWIVRISVGIHVTRGAEEERKDGEENEEMDVPFIAKNVS